MDEFWSFKRLTTFSSIYLNEKLVFMDNLDLFSSAIASVAEKVGKNFKVFGYVLLVGEETDVVSKQALNAYGSRWVIMSNYIYNIRQK